MWTLLIFLFVASSTATQPAPLQEFTNASNRFALDIYKEIAKTRTGNFLVSPFLVEILLALTRSGARGPTAEEIRKALHFPNDAAAFDRTLQSLIPKFKTNDPYTLQAANKIYVKKNNFRIRADFKNASKSVFGVDCEEIDFLHKEDAATMISSWIESRTNNKIKNLIKPDDLSDDTKAVMVNALYFKAKWSNPFPLQSTRKRNFYKSRNEIIRVDTMQIRQKYFKHYERPDLKAQFLEIPFKGDNISMVIILPNAKNGLPDLEKRLDRIFSLPDKPDYGHVNVALPRFRMESSTNMKNALKDLGVRLVFDAHQADLSGISEGLVVDKVMQKSFIDVGEGGVEATAGTYFNFELRTWQLEDPKEFIVDRPFVFYVRVEGLVVFIGRVVDPSERK